MSTMNSYHVTITATDGSTTTGTYSEAQALSLLRRSVARGCTVEASRRGGARIVRKVRTVHTSYGPPSERVITLEPATPARPTAQVRADLEGIGRRRSFLVREASHYQRGRIGRIYAGLYAIPPGTAAKLVARGLVVIGEAYATCTDTRADVSLSLAARLAMLAQDHQTRTREPRGQ
jgi:hypothetical protein